MFSRLIKTLCTETLKRKNHYFKSCVFLFYFILLGSLAPFDELHRRNGILSQKRRKNSIGARDAEKPVDRGERLLALRDAEGPRARFVSRHDRLGLAALFRFTVSFQIQISYRLYQIRRTKMTGRGHPARGLSGFERK